MSEGAIDGESGAYVPCLELPSPFPDDPVGAITGSDVGFVPKDMEASAFPDDPVGAISGSDVGFVPGPCVLGIFIGKDGYQVVEAAAMGGATSVSLGPTYRSAASGSLVAGWSSYDGSTIGIGNLGRAEMEVRLFLTWLVPLTTTYVRLLGTIRGYFLVVDTETNNRPQSTDATYEMGPIAFDPDVDPTDFDDSGSGYGGTVTFLDPYPVGLPSGSFAQVPIALDIINDDIGGLYTDIAGAYGPALTQYRLFQWGVRCTSTEGVGRHTWFAGVHPDEEVIEVVDRYPDNPNWVVSPYFDYSQVQSGVRIALDVYAG